MHEFNDESKTMYHLQKLVKSVLVYTSVWFMLQITVYFAINSTWQLSDSCLNTEAGNVIGISHHPLPIIATYMYFAPFTGRRDIYGIHYSGHSL